jgi:predicted component of type VI protein secretion system
MKNFKLNFRSGFLAGREETISTKEIIIGRDPVHPMSIDDVKVSRNHLKIFSENELLMLEDLGSTNGTFVNGKRVTNPTRLRNGDLVSLGENNVFEVSITEPEPILQENNAEDVYTSQEKKGTEEEIEINNIPAKQVKKVITENKPITKFFSTLPTWALVLFIAIGFFILFCLIPFVVIEVTNQWCNLFSGFFNAISPGICP